MRSRVCLIVVAAGLLALPGCNQAPMAPVRGKVVCNGKPVKDAAITFSPVPKSESDKESGKPATAYSDAEGNYVLSTHKPYDGALVGPHRVTVSLEDTNPARCLRVTKLTQDVKPGDNDLTLDITP